MWVCGHDGRCPWKPEMSDPQALELQWGVSCLEWVLPLSSRAWSCSPLFGPTDNCLHLHSLLNFWREKNKNLYSEVYPFPCLLLQTIYIEYTTFEIIIYFLCVLIYSCMVVHILGCINLHSFAYQSCCLCIVNPFIWVIQVKFSLW